MPKTDIRFDSDYSWAILGSNQRPLRRTTATGAGTPENTTRPERFSWGFRGLGPLSKHDEAPRSALLSGHGSLRVSWAILGSNQ
jgi:hypothetical protein